MHCGACSKDLHPVIQGGQSGAFVYTCANAECGAVLGPVRRDGAAPAPAPVAEAAPTQPRAVPTPAAVGPKPALIDGMRARLAELESTLPALIEERTTLRRMLAAADRKPRAPRSNVLPIKKVAT